MVLGAAFLLSVVLRGGMLGRPAALAPPTGFNDALWDLVTAERMDLSSATPGALRCAPDLAGRLNTFGHRRDPLGPCVADGWDSDYLSAYRQVMRTLGSEPEPHR